MEKLLLLGGSAQQVIAIETAKRMGYATVLCDYLPDNPGQYAADAFYLVSTTDKESVLQVARQEQVQGVLAYASDPAAPTAAYVAQQLGLPGNPYDSVETLCHKDRFRAFLRQNGFCTPAAKGYTSLQEAQADIEASVFQLPVIVKPVDSSGSKGATVLRSPQELAQTLTFAQTFSRSHRIIVEEFIEKKHPFLIGGDIFVSQGKIVLWGLLNCHRDPLVNPLVPVGKSFPLCLPPSDIENVKACLTALVEKLGMRNGAMNVELVVDKHDRVFPIDIGPRGGGNMIPDLLGDIFSVDIPAMCVQAAMGAPIQVAPHKPDGCYATYNLHCNQDGIYKDVIFSPEIEPYIYRKCLYCKPGDPVHYFDNASKCLGILFMKFRTQSEMLPLLAHMQDLITVRRT